MELIDSLTAVPCGMRTSPPVEPKRSEKTLPSGLAIEFFAFFGILPLLLHAFRLPLVTRLLPLLIAAAMICLILLCKDQGFDTKRLWSRPAIRPFRHLLPAFSLAAILIGLLCSGIVKKQFLFIFGDHPQTSLPALLSFPLISAYAQEVIFRGYFFHRYHSLFRQPEMLVMANSLSFGLFHLSHDNWIDPFMAAILGMVFGYRYLKTRSLMPVAIEHALYGKLLMMVGLGWLFYSGSPG